MRLVRALLIFVIFNLYFSAANEYLFDAPIELTSKKDCSIEEFCQQFIDDIDIEKFIKKELKSNYTVVSLDECLDVALKNNFDIAILECDYFSSKYEYQNSLSKFLPILSTTSYISDYSGQILVGGVLRDKFHETAISVNITAQHDLTQGGKTVFQAKAAKYFSKSKKHQLHFSKSQIIYLTVKYYYEALLAKINIEIYLRNLIERNAQLTLAKNLANSGFGTKFDVIRARSEANDAKNKLLNVLNNFRISQTRLANIMGIDVETSLMPFEDDISIMKLVDENNELNVFYEQAKTYHEELKSYKDLISYEKEIKNIYITDFIPKPLVNMQQQFQGTINTSINPNYILSGLLYWQPGENTILGTMTKIKAQKQKIKMRQLEYENKLRNLQQQIINSRSTSIFSAKQIKINKERLEFSNQSIKLAMLRFNNGNGILIDVIQAQTEATRARIDYVSSIINYNISQAELLYNSGILSIKAIKDNYRP